MKKPVFYTELAYVLGLLLLAVGTALTAFSGFGVSMVVAPAYVLHLKLNAYLPWFSFGFSEYVLQSVIFLVMLLVLKRVKARYFLSFAVALCYGFLLDGATRVLQPLPCAIPIRLGAFALGVIMCTLAISLLFRSYLPLMVYELFVKEIAVKFGLTLSAVKTVYDCASLALAIAISVTLLSKLQGIGIGTVVCAACYGLLIRCFSGVLDKHFVFVNCFHRK